MDKRDAYRRAWELRIAREYNATPEDVARQWERQRGRCPLCNVDLNTKVWVIDHHHKSGKFRGLLDAWCNHRVLSMAERAGEIRSRNVVYYLWGRKYETVPDTEAEEGTERQELRARAA